MDLKQAVAEVKSKLNIVDFFQQKGFELKRAGGTRWLALCPFHNEKTPSFSVNETLGSYYCFGCHKSGDLFSYLEEKEGLSFMEALETECSQLGIDWKPDEKSAQERSRRKQLMAVTADAWKFFRQKYDELPEEHRAKAYEIREKRGISSDAADNHYLFGWAPENRRLVLDYLRGRGHLDDDMVAAGVMRRSERDGGLYCLWGGRLMFPICDVLGRPVGFAGRQVFYERGQKIDRKYVNSPETEIYHKRDLLFCQSIAREQARHDHEVFVVEGQFDVIAMQHSGHDNTVASSGTALSLQQAQALRRMVGADGKLVFMFDADAAGQKAALRTFMELGPIQTQAWASVTEGKDPSDMLKDEGPGALSARAENNVELWRFVTESLASQFDMSDTAAAREFAVKFNEAWRTMSDPGVSDSAIRLASLKSGMSVQALQAAGDPRQKKAAAQPDDQITVDSTGLDMGEDPAAVALNASMLENPKLRPLLAFVKMDGIDDKFRKWLLKKGEAIVAPEDMQTDEGTEYVRRLQRAADRMHALDLASPLPVDPAELVAQQIQVLEKSHRAREMRRALLSVSGAGKSTDLKTLEEYDEKIRGRLTEIDGENADMSKKVGQLLAELAPDAGPGAVVRSGAGDAVDGNAFTAKRSAMVLETMRKRRLETVDDAEPFYAWPNGEYGDSEAPYYDPSMEPGDEWSRERDEAVYEA